MLSLSDLDEYGISKLCQVADNAIGSGSLLFNFSASYSGGGYKRLYNYAKWFDSHGGANFIIHHQCSVLAIEFPCNRYFIVSPGRWERLLRDGAYMNAILATLPRPSLYYSYGIPLFDHFGQVNWFHLSNALPVVRERIPMSLFDRLKFSLLGWRIRRSLINADVISAESESSLDLIGREYGSRLFVSGNGFDEDLTGFRRPSNDTRSDLAVVVGTYRYKALNDAYRVFNMLRAKCPQLRLRIFGSSDKVPSELRKDVMVELVGIQPHSVVLDALRNARHYISTSHIENSSNADIEGVFLSENAWLSDIDAHREMLSGITWSSVQVPGMDRQMIHISCEEMSTIVLKSWKQVIEEMLARYEYEDVNYQQ